MAGLYPYKGTLPQVEEDVFIAPGATVIGKVTLKKGVNIWYNAVIRGDVEAISVDEYTNIQDSCIVHADPGSPIIIGKYVTIGHNAVLHGCKLNDYSLIGMGAIVLNDAEIGEGAVIGAGALVTEGTKIPPYSVVVGSPAKVIKTLDSSSFEERKTHALRYYKLSRAHAESLSK
ncbi:MAG: ferripyochelin binding protein (fbp) [Peptococcaceae bacterium]|jgi:carbonic anhydrase/acetyltransferase-like protein (isoleucine patch superfamily)|nr:ferripyochelin binding protein (fbp) [Peptococcaceae bacterium]